jgi:hypothetical protein
MSVLHDQVKCGDCGEETFTIIQLRSPEEYRVGGAGDGRVDGVLQLHCCRCGSTSTIKPLPAAFAVDGNACSGW